MRSCFEEKWDGKWVGDGEGWGWGVKRVAKQPCGPFTWVRRGVIIHANIDPLCIRTIRGILCKPFGSIFKILRIYQGVTGFITDYCFTEYWHTASLLPSPRYRFWKKVAPYMIRKRGVSRGQVFTNEQAKVRKMTQIDFWLTYDLW